MRSLSIKNTPDYVVSKRRERACPTPTQILEEARKLDLNSKSESVEMIHESRPSSCLNRTASRSSHG